MTANEECPWGRRATQRLEFAPAWSDAAQRAMVAFANTYGGTVYFGLNEAGVPLGVDDFDEIERSIFSFARNGVNPDMSRLIRVKPIHLPDGKTAAAAQILPGDDRPYAFKNKGWTNGGVFIRIGASSLQARRSDIMSMAKDLMPWEARISRRQDLTFNEARSICEKASLPWTEANFVQYGIADANGLFTNFGFLISDQNDQNLKISKFLGEGGRYAGGITLAGSILKQREDALQHLSKLNAPLMGKTAGPEERAYPWPPSAVREALTSSIAHRDYSISLASPITVIVFSDRMVFQTVATLPEGLTMADLFLDGFSACMNRRITQLFIRLHWMEEAGSNFAGIFAGYASSRAKPSCTCSTRIFRISLPKRFDAANLNERTAELIRVHGSLSARELVEKIDAARSTLNKTLKALVVARQIIKTGAGRSTRYRLRD